MTRRLGGLLLGGVGLLTVACGPRLRHAEEPKQEQAAALPDAPVANITVKHADPSKVDANGKYTQPGSFTVDGLFYKDGQPQSVTVNVTVHEHNGSKHRAYNLDLAPLGGTVAKVEMWDDGFLTVVIPAAESGAPQPQFQTSNENVKAAGLELGDKAGEPSTCYFSKQVVEGKLRFALCDLQGQTPRVVFVDAPAEAAAPEAPAAGAPGGAAPATAAAPAK